MEQPRNSPVRSWQQFTLSELFLWMTYIGIAATLCRWHLASAVLFLVWIAPAISRYRATLFIDELHAFHIRNGHGPAVLGLAFQCIGIELGLSILALLPVMVLYLGIAILFNLIVLLGLVGPVLSATAQTWIVNGPLIALALLALLFHVMLNYVTWPTKTNRVRLKPAQ